jgi:hypothetical protein
MMQQPMQGGGVIRIRHRIVAVLAIALASVPPVLPYVTTTTFASVALSRLRKNGAAKPARRSS